MMLHTLQRFKEVCPQQLQTATAWVANDTVMPSNVSDVVKFQRLPAGMQPHAAKAYVIQNTGIASDTHVLFLDVDSWPCPGWFAGIYHYAANLSVDVTWTEAPFSACGGYAGKSCALAISPSIQGPILSEYKKMAERNTGTLFMVKKSERTRKWLSDVREIYEKMQSSDIQKGGGHGGNADQPSFREAFFLHRNELKEALVPNSLGCRTHPRDSKKCEGQCYCACSECLFVHHKVLFDACSKYASD